jgi:hypothetical protein
LPDKARQKLPYVDSFLTFEPWRHGRSQLPVNSTKGCKQIAEEEIGVVVGIVDGVPGCGKVVFGNPLANQRSLAGARRTGNQSEPPIPAGRQPSDKMRARQPFCDKGRYG